MILIAAPLQLALQTTFHRPPPSCPVPYPPRPIFTRPRAHTPADANIESGTGTLGAYEGSFYKNAYAMVCPSHLASPLPPR